jgi:hypothetical protein
MNGAGTFDLDEATARLAAMTPAGRLGLPVIGLAWATVDTDRAVAELTRALRDAAPFEPGVAEALLGGSSLLGRAMAGRVRLVILEPSTESRLAATLARHDEGPAGLWVRLSGRALPADLALSDPADGPFGRERLVLGAPIGGPHLLVVEEPAGTIDG